MPAAPAGFVQPWLVQLGVDQPFDARPDGGVWMRDLVVEPGGRSIPGRNFGGDSDVRELLTKPGDHDHTGRSRVYLTSPEDVAAARRRARLPRPSRCSLGAVPVANLFAAQVLDLDHRRRRGPARRRGVRRWTLFLLQVTDARASARNAIYKRVLAATSLAGPRGFAVDEPILARRPGLRDLPTPARASPRN